MCHTHLGVSEYCSVGLVHSTNDGGSVSVTGPHKLIGSSTIKSCGFGGVGVV